MLCSVFTPVNRVDYLEEAYRSLLLQSVPWEWVIGLTRDLIREHIPDTIRADKRVRIIQCSRPTEAQEPGIGLAKRECCQAATGDVFVELDHDDILVPGILEHVARLIDRGAGFVYSNAAVFRQEPGFPASEYDETYGWSTYPVRVFGREFRATRSFDITARSLADIMFAPDHVRCWSRKAYWRAGGHDPDLGIGDDHDLLCRTYLTGATFAHTGSCGYLYRWHGRNSTRAHNPQIQRQNVKNRNRYINSLIDEWVRREDLPRITIPSHEVPNRQLKKLPDSSHGLVLFDHSFERGSVEQSMRCFQEAFRTLQPGGWLTIRVVSSVSKWAELPHCRSRWNEIVISQICSPSYLQFRGTALDLELVPHFQPVRIAEIRDRSVDQGHDSAPYIRIEANLCALKGQKQPGLIPD